MATGALLVLPFVAVLVVSAALIGGVTSRTTAVVAVSALVITAFTHTSTASALIDPTTRAMVTTPSAIGVAAAVTGWVVLNIDGDPLALWGLVLGTAASTAVLAVVRRARDVVLTAIGALVVTFLPPVAAYLSGAGGPAWVARSVVAFVLLLVVVLAVDLPWAWWRSLQSAERESALEAARAVWTERRRISRDLHDLQGRALEVIGFEAELAERLLQHRPETALEHLVTIQRTAREAMAEHHEVIARVRPVDLLAEHRALVALLRSGRVDLDVEGSPETVPPELHDVLGAVLREGGTNALRHGRPRRVDLCYSVRPEFVRLRLTNDGGVLGSSRDRDRDRGGQGLRGLRERVEALGGTLSAGWTGEQAWELSAWLPRASSGPELRHGAAELR